MVVIVGLAGFVLLVVEILLVVRTVLDLVGELTPGGGFAIAPRRTGRGRRGNNWVLAGRLSMHALTEPVLKPVRRVVPPLRVGSKLVDLALILVFVAVLLLRTVLVGL
ncbi:YggT family protein [Pseudonocardia lacus]|uniref:YggT family protein n=1 Tax=Pseudonocardia lacus TaxID=2835865 RepID=UPI001BDD917B|nr:YggT family protein [Pseudonocardia lacus]